jgi:hypothetical protein
VLTSLAKKGYFGGFYFWLDVVATVSLLFDIPAVMTLLTPVGAGQTSGQGGTLARAGRSANAGSKMGRILRLVRVIRMMRLIHRYEQRVKAARRASAAAKAAGTTHVAARIVHPRLERNTRVGEKLSDLTTRCDAWARAVRCAWRVLTLAAYRAPQARHCGRAAHPVRHAAV